MTTVHLLFFCCCFSFFLSGIYRTVEAFIRSKYERKQYLKKDGLPPTRSTSSSAKETKSADKVMIEVHKLLCEGSQNFFITLNLVVPPPPLKKKKKEIIDHIIWFRIM